MRRAITNRLIEGLRPGPKRQDIRDVRLPRFGLRVGLSGGVSFYVSYHYGLKQRRLKLGDHPLISLDEARTQAIDVLRMADDGFDPASSRCSLSHLVKDIAADFIEKYAKPKCRTARDMEALLRREFVNLHGHRDIRTIERREIHAILDSTVARGAPYQANRIRSLLHKFFSWAVSRDIVKANPVQGTARPSKERRRNRVLSDAEITRLIGSFRAIGYPFGDLYLMLILTGARRGEVSSLRWSEIDRDAKVWRLPADRAKNDHAHSIPLSAAALRILDHLPRRKGTDFAFTTNGRTPVTGWGRSKEQVAVNAEVTGWRLHDLRRTAASGMARLGVAPHVIEKVLNHVSGEISGVAAIYNLYGYDVEMRDALDRWGAYIDGLGKQAPSNRSEDPLSPAA